MNCCNEYGECRQGRDCPVRKERLERIIEAKRLLDRDQAKIPTLLLGRLALAAIALLIVVVSLYTDAARVAA